MHSLFILFFAGFAIYFSYGISHSLQGQRNNIVPDTLTQKYAEPVKLVTRF